MKSNGDGREARWQTQTTLRTAVEASGVGLHSGARSSIRLLPATAGRGIVFRRTDLDNFEIDANWRHVARVSYATSLMRKGVLIQTTEHLLSALVGCAVDNAIIEIDSLELPILDGSGVPFVEMVRKSGTRRQRAPRTFVKVLSPLEVCENGKRIAIYPADAYRVTCTIDFPHPLIGHQSVTVDLTAENFASQVAPARTFGFLRDEEALRNMGLIRGASLENALVLDDTRVVNAAGLRFPDEFCRHKLLDLIGDLALVGRPILGHIVAERAGHYMHVALVDRLMRDRSLWTEVRLEANAGAPAKMQASADGPGYEVASAPALVESADERG